MGKTYSQKAWLIWNYKTDRVRARKTRPDRSDIGANDFVAEVKLSANVPDEDIVNETVSAEFDVPMPMLESAVAEALDTRSFVDWQKDAESLIAERIDQIREADEAVLVENLVNGLTIETLRAAKGRPDIDEVERYIEQSVGEISRGDGDE